MTYVQIVHYDCIVHEFVLILPTYIYNIYYYGSIYELKKKLQTKSSIYYTYIYTMATDDVLDYPPGKY